MRNFRFSSSVMDFNTILFVSYKMMCRELIKNWAWWCSSLVYKKQLCNLCYDRQHLTCRVIHKPFHPQKYQCVSKDFIFNQFRSSCMCYALPTVSFDDLSSWKISIADGYFFFSFKIFYNQQKCPSTSVFYFNFRLKNIWTTFEQYGQVIFHLLLFPKFCLQIQPIWGLV